MQNTASKIFADHGKKNSSKFIKACEKLHSLYLDLAFKDCAKTQTCEIPELWKSKE